MTRPHTTPFFPTQRRETLSHTDLCGAQVWGDPASAGFGVHVAETIARGRVVRSNPPTAFLPSFMFPPLEFVDRYAHARSKSCSCPSEPLHIPPSPTFLAKRISPSDFRQKSSPVTGKAEKIGGGFFCFHHCKAFVALQNSSQSCTREARPRSALRVY